MPLLRATLSDLPNGCICLSTAERQSLASKARRNDRMGKENDATKKEEDEIKLWRELLDGSSYINSACRPIHNQFGVVGIQALEQAISHPPRNVHSSPTVSSPRREEPEQKRLRKNSKTRRLTKRK
ncbi:6097_t:CDS:2, partial [Cetraspora pellucida]